MLMRQLLLSCLCLFLTAATAAAEPVADARLVGGRSVRGSLLSVDASALRLAAAGREVSVPLKQLVRWGHPLSTREVVTVEGRPVTQLILADGSLLVGDLLKISDERATLLSDYLDAVSLPLGMLRGAILQAPASQQQRDLLARRVEQSTTPSDLLILVNGDELAGQLVDMQQDKFTLRTELGDVEVTVEKLAAVVLNPQLVDKTAPFEEGVLVGLSDGSLLKARTLRVSPGVMQMTLACGLELESRQPQEVVSLQPLTPAVTYLSDLEPHSYRHVPYLSIEWPYHADRNVLGSRLSVQKQLYNKGLGMHSAARLAYRLDRPYARFAADMALDDSAGNAGSVVFRVFVNSGDTWQQIFTSPVIRGGDKPVPVSIELKDVQALILMVDYADRGDVLDHANWLDARLEAE